MKYLLFIVACLIARHYRRAMIRHARRANALRATVDALAQERWESAVRAARIMQRDLRTAEKMRALKATVDFLTDELESSSDALVEATVAVRDAEARVGGRCAADATWN